MKTFLGFLLVTIVTHAGEPGAARDLSRQATDLYNQARYAEAEPLFRRALEAWTRLGPEAALERAIDMRNLGSLLRVRGRLRRFRVAQKRARSAEFVQFLSERKPRWDAMDSEFR